MTIKEYIQKYILLKIVSQDWKPGDTLPSENQIAKKFECSRITARQALTAFVRAGILKAQKGKGYVIVPSGTEDLFQSNTSRFKATEVKTIWLSDEEIEQHYDFIQENYINKTNYIRNFDKNKTRVFLKEYYDDKGLVCVQITYLKDAISRLIDDNQIDKSVTRAFIDYAVLPTAQRKEYFAANDFILGKYKEQLGWNTDAVTSIKQLFSGDKLLEVAVRVVRRDSFYIRTKKELLL